MRRLLLPCPIVLMTFVFAVPAAAQFPQGPPELIMMSPAPSATRHALNPKIRVEYSSGTECLDPGDGSCNPIPSTLEVRINGGSNVAGTGWTVTEWYAENGLGNAGINNFSGSSGTTTSNTLYARICNEYDCAQQTITVYIQPGPQEVLDITPLHAAVYDPSFCPAVPFAPGAAFRCDGFTYTHGIPGYVALGAGRGVSISYSSRSIGWNAPVAFDVEMIWDAAASTVEAQLGTAPAKHWNGRDWDGTSGTVRRQVVLNLPYNTAAGGYIGRTVVPLSVTVHTSAGAYTANAQDTVPYYFERDTVNTPIARGWSIDGISRLYGEAGDAPGAPAPDGSVLIVGGAPGGIWYYKKLAPWADYGRPAGALATLTRTAAGQWQLLSIDGTRQYYGWNQTLGYARLDSVRVHGQTTRIAYRSGSGAPLTITDPLGKQIRFDYSGSGFGALTQICAPAGANERCTTLQYGTSFGNTVLTGITDPDGVQTTFEWMDTWWESMNAFTPRGRGRYDVGWHGTNIGNWPNGVTLPGGDWLEYRAAQLAGFPLTGGTSGSPATSAHPDSGWGWVKQPLGQMDRFAVDRFGGVTYSRGLDNVVSRTARNTQGQPVWIQRNGQYLQYWTYNGMGALQTYNPEAGDTSRYIYPGSCATAYPCLPIAHVRIRTPYVPDTTRWAYSEYSTAGVVDSTYRSSFGWTHFWRQSVAGFYRADSVVDPLGHTRRFVYEGTWGNLHAELGDSVKVCEIGGGCTFSYDSTRFGYDVTGRLSWTRNGETGRKVGFLRDLMARDTLVADTSPGGAVITGGTRYNDVARTVTVVDGRGNTIAFLHDDRGRRIRRTDAAGARDTFAYDANDRLVSWTTRRNQTLTYAYDVLGRLRTKTVPGTGGGTWTYGYHATHGTLDTLLSPGANLYRARDWLGRMTQEKTVASGVTRTVNYAYGEGALVTGLTDPWGGTYTFGWNAATRSRTVTNPFSETYSIRHNADGLITSVVFPTGLDSLEYNADHQVEAAGLNAEITYTRDPETKGINEITWGGVTQSFEYDGFGRLASEATSTSGYGPTSENFTYDAAGNRSGTPGTYTYAATNAARGRPAISGDSYAPGDSLVYDAAGNPTWWKNKTTGQYDVLTWDAENRLIRLQRYSSGGGLELDVNYAYDGFGRRVRKWGTGVTERRYAWRGWELLAEMDASGNATRRYTHHPDGIDFPVAMREGSTSHYFHRDGQGNVYKVTNASGTPRSEYRYRAWGDRYNVGTENVLSPVTYKGREEDRETGLIYQRHRYYSPRLERFLNQDLIGISGGLNVYGFTGGNPVGFSDPLGLAVELAPIYAYGWIGIPRWVEEQWFSGYMNSLDVYSDIDAGSVVIGPGGGGAGGDAGTSWGNKTNSQEDREEESNQDALNNCRAESFSGAVLRNAFVFGVAATRMGWKASGPVAARLSTTAGVVTTLSTGGAGTLAVMGSSYVVTRLAITGLSALGGGLVGAVVGAGKGLLDAFQPGSCVGTAH